MGRISRDIVEAVRDRTDIVEVVSRHVQIVRRGKDFLGLCPFHQEKSPSFHVIPDKAMFLFNGLFPRTLPSPILELTEEKEPPP